MKFRNWVGSGVVVLRRGRAILRRGPAALRRRWKWWLLLGLALAGLGWWQYRRVQNSHPSLTFQKPQMENLIKTLDVSGVVDAKEKARLRFISGGKVTYLGAKTGETVKKGQTIAVIDQATLKKQLEQDLNTYLKERYIWEQTNYDIFQNELTLTEERTRKKGQLDLNSEVLDVEVRDIAIKNTRLSAPFAGILTVSPTNVPGAQLLSTDYFELVNPESLVFKAEVDESDIAQVKSGQITAITLDSHPDQPVTTNVDLIAYTSSETSSGTVFVVELPLSTTIYGTDFFRLGMNGDAAIQVDTRSQVLTIPLIATKERDGQTYVDVRSGEQTTQEREIQIGLENDEKVEVVTGLTAQDEILIPE